MGGRVRLRGFTIVPDALVKAHGLHAALVFGYVYRWPDHRCSHAIATYASAIGVSSATVWRSLKTLVEDGWLQLAEDDPGAESGLPRCYRCTEAVMLELSISTAGGTNREGAIHTDEGGSSERRGGLVTETNVNSSNSSNTIKQRKKKPRLKTPRDLFTTAIIEYFTEITGIRAPTTKGELKTCWWVPATNMGGAVDYDIGEGKQMLRETQAYMKEKSWTILTLKSMVKTYCMLAAKETTGVLDLS